MQAPRRNRRRRETAAGRKAAWAPNLIFGSAGLYLLLTLDT